jgi:hypothetical protein
VASWLRRAETPGRRLVRGAAALVPMDPALVDGAVVILITHTGAPVVAHNSGNRDAVPDLLREVADAYEQKIRADGN